MVVSGVTLEAVQDLVWIFLASGLELGRDLAESFFFPFKETFPSL